MRSSETDGRRGRWGGGGIVTVTLFIYMSNKQDRKSKELHNRKIENPKSEKQGQLLTYCLSE